MLNASAKKDEANKEEKIENTGKEEMEEPVVPKAGDPALQKENDNQADALKREKEAEVSLSTEKENEMLHNIADEKKTQQRDLKDDKEAEKKRDDDTKRKRRESDHRRSRSSLIF